MFVSMILPNLAGEGGSFSSSGNKDSQGELDHRNHQLAMQQDMFHVSSGVAANGDVSASTKTPTPVRKKRNLPGTPDPTAEVIALSPTTLMARNRFVCEICNKGFQRDQNLQLHRRGHNLPWKLRQRERGTAAARKRVYVCPETTCVHHDPRRALGDLTGIKKHFFRKHGEKKWRCARCGKRYAVQSDWKAHTKTCGTREYKCDCGTIFSRRDSFISHRAFCNALAEESNRAMQQQALMSMASSMGLGAATAHAGMLALQPQITSPEPPAASNNSNKNNDGAAVLVGSMSTGSGITSTLRYANEAKVNGYNPPMTIRPPFTTSTARTATDLAPAPLSAAAVIHDPIDTTTPWSAATALLQMGPTCGGYRYHPHQQPQPDGSGFAAAQDVAPGMNGVGLFPAQEGTSAAFGASVDLRGGVYAPRYDGGRDGPMTTVDFLGRTQ